VNGFFVTGTDTDVGKTVVSAWLLAHLDACYWKPVQAGTEPETDSATVRRLAEVEADRIVPEAYLLSEPPTRRRSGLASPSTWRSSSPLLATGRSWSRAPAG